LATVLLLNYVFIFLSLRKNSTTWGMKIEVMDVCFKKTLLNPVRNLIFSSVMHLNLLALPCAALHNHRLQRFPSSRKDRFLTQVVVRKIISRIIPFSTLSPVPPFSNDSLDVRTTKWYTCEPRHVKAVNSAVSFQFPHKPLI